MNKLKRKKTLIDKLFYMFVGLSLLSASLVPSFATTNTPRDYDSNSVMYGGAYTKDEFINKMNKGDGKHTDLKQIYVNEFGLNTDQISSWVDGSVTKTGTVVYNNEVVGKNVLSAGRSNMSGSVRIGSLYWRSPSVSFVSTSIPAWIRIDVNGNASYAILKSCGNPVKVRAWEKGSIKIEKFNDVNGNGKWDTNEQKLGKPFLMKLSNGKSVYIGTNGEAWFHGVKEGNYQITEGDEKSWVATTRNPVPVHVDANKVTTIQFGNKAKTVPQQFGKVKVIKFNDLDGDGTKDSNESILGLPFVMNLSGTNYDKSNGINSNGEALFENVPVGSYKVTEVIEKDWDATTPIIKLEVKCNELTVVYYGNKKKEKEPTPTPTPTPSPTPTPTPTPSPTPTCTPTPTPTPTPCPSPTPSPTPIPPITPELPKAGGEAAILFSFTGLGITGYLKRKTRLDLLKSLKKY